MPKISIIVPVYKAEACLKKCVDSALSQSYADVEVILVDDGSPDRSGEMCDSFAAGDPRVQVLHQANSGVSAARNSGIATASGEYILFLDSDDYLEADACKKLIGALMKCGADIAACGSYSVSQNGTKIPVPFFLPAGSYDRRDIMEEIVRPMVVDRTSERALDGFIWRYLFSRSIIISNGISFEGAYLEDEIFLLEYLCCASSLTVIQEYLYNYYNNPESATKRYMRNFEEIFLGFFEAKNRLIQKFDIVGVSGWENSTLWAGILIAVGNEYAPGNDISLALKQKRIKTLCEKEPFKAAMAAWKPYGAGKRKKIVVDLLASKKYTLLTLLYALKNSGR